MAEKFQVLGFGTLSSARRDGWEGLLTRGQHLKGGAVYVHFILHLINDPRDRTERDCTETLTLISPLQTQHTLQTLHTSWRMGGTCGAVDGTPAKGTPGILSPCSGAGRAALDMNLPSLVIRSCARVAGPRQRACSTHMVGD